MKRVAPLIAFGTFVLLNGAVFSAPIGAYYQVMQAVYARDETGLKYLISVGLNINATNMQGKTALCTAVENQDYEGYELLLSQGATTRTPCMRNMNPEILAKFRTEQPPLGTYYKGAVLTASRNGALMGAGKDVATTIGSLPYPHIGEILLGGVAVGTAFAVGVHGSGGGGDDPVDPSKYNYEAPFQSEDSSKDNYLKAEFFSSPTDDTLALTKPSDPSKTAANYQTEYAGGSWGSVSHINFLNKINASDAYARGYSGYKINRDSDGNLIGSGWNAVSSNRVKVAVMDNGQYYNTDLYNADQTTSSVKGLNYVYGAKSDANDSYYWSWGLVDDTTEAAILYKNKVATTYIPMAESEWLKYKGQFMPVCSAGKNNCLTTTKTADAKGYYTVYYVSGLYDENTTYTSANTDATYYTYPYLWDLYESKFGSTGYIYDSTDAYGKFFKSTQDDTVSHGTHVAGIIAAQRNGSGMQGVAYNAEVIPVKLDLGMGQTLNHVSDVISAYPDLKIINLSIGPVDYTADSYTDNDPVTNKNNWDQWGRTNYLADSLAAAKENNVALIFSAGNGDANKKGLPQSSIFSAAPLVDSAFKNLLINVVALGNDNTIASYSNRCGATASYCLAAPGGDGDDWMISTGISKTAQSSYQGMQGTSQAAPVVSGSLAVLMGAFPFLTSQQAVQILLDTASYITPTEDEITAYNALKPTGWETSVYKEETDASGKKYNSIYGRGLVDLNAATDPVGQAT